MDESMFRSARMRVLGLVTGMLMLVAACGGNDGPSIPTPTPVGSSEGQRLFATKGCAARHGSMAKGRAISPALFEHSADQIARQLRAGLGSMPIYPPAKISDTELIEIPDISILCSVSMATSVLKTSTKRHSNTTGWPFWFWKLDRSKMRSIMLTT